MKDIFSSFTNEKFLLALKDYWSSAFAMAGAACLAVGSLDFDRFTLGVAVGYLIIGSLLLIEKAKNKE